MQSREIVSNTCPIVVVSCLRDIKLLALQAQSIDQWLCDPHDIYIVVNETVLKKEWDRQFDFYCRSWYKNHNLNILYKEDFDCSWSKNPSPKWQGWDNQQLLKLAVSSKLNSACYFVLDSQNFLINSWSTKNYLFEDKCPGRKNVYAMYKNTWVEYSKSLGLNQELPTQLVMTISTPIYLRSDLVNSLISNFGRLKDFSVWFFEQDCSLSEFVLYYLWAEKNGGYDSFHYDVGNNNTWNGPMMRLQEGKSILKERDLVFFLANLGKRKKESWVSITHNSWTILSGNEFEKLSKSLKNHNIDIGLMFN